MFLFSTITGVAYRPVNTLTDTMPSASTPTTATSTTETVSTTPGSMTNTSNQTTRTSTTPATAEDYQAPAASTRASAGQTLTTNATSTSVTSSNVSPNSSSGFETVAMPAQTSALANASASARVVINVGSYSGDGEGTSGVIVVDTSDQGVSTGTVIGIVSGSVAAVLLILGAAFWLYRRRIQKLIIRSSSSNPFYGPIILECATPSSAIAVRGLSDFDGTVDLDSTANFDSTLRRESSTGSKRSSKSKSSLWEDEVIMAARIPMEKLIRKKKINEGGHGAVYHGLYHDECVAIKVLLPEKRKDMRQINAFLSEIKIMATVDHPRIVRFIGVAWDALSDLCAVSEFMPGGDLFTLLRRFDYEEHRIQGFDIDKANIAFHVAQALTYLHSLDPIILHRDLKSMNILLSDEWEAKLTDFGVSRRWTVDTMTAGIGTRRWMAPEVMMGKRYDTSADIFSFGVVLSELDSHQPPYASAIASITSESGEKVTETALMEMVAMGRIRVNFSSNAPSAVVHLGHACVDLNPRSRPSANEVHYQLQKILRKYQKYTI